MLMRERHSLDVTFNRYGMNFFLFHVRCTDDLIKITQVFTNLITYLLTLSLITEPYRQKLTLTGLTLKVNPN